MISCIYIERLCATQCLVLSHQNIHRLIATAVLIADKFYDDDGCSNKGFADSAGVHLLELNKVEINFLIAIGFELHVSQKEVRHINTSHFLLIYVNGLSVSRLFGSNALGF